MKKRFLAIIALIVVTIAFYNPIVSYFYLWSFDYHRGQDVAYRHNSFLKKAIDSAQLARWNNVPLTISERYTPKEPNIIRARFTRGAIFPTRQILLEYIVAEHRDDTLSGGLVGYADIVYLHQTSDGEYKYIGKFRKFIP
ncbi:MAG: hypothetical protein HC860_24195 [Alkalinema sp. RU_4_3]|nr:hypothetical protein [Alkalinema sp. RU_4_3]